MNSSANAGLEARGFGLQLIAADLHIEKSVAAVLICSCRLDHSGGDIFQGDFAARYNRMRLVANHPRNGRGIELSETRARGATRQAHKDPQSEEYVYEA